MSISSDDRSLTELEFVEVAVRRTVKYATRAQQSLLLRLAHALLHADISEMNGGGDTRLRELMRLRRIQE